MNLTPRQENMISVFLRQAAQHMESIPAERRARSLADTKSRLREELRRFGIEPLTDEHVAAALRRCQLQFPSNQELDLLSYSIEENTSPEFPTPLPVPAGPEHSRKYAEMLVETAPEKDGWLGVCRELSDKAGLEATYLRTVFLLLGLATGPIGLTAYLAMYAWLYTTSPAGTFPPANLWRVFTRAFGTAFTAIALYGVAYGLFVAAKDGVPRFLNKPFALGEWAWLDAHHESYLFWVLVLSMPLAVLSALPLPNAWDQTTKRIVQAGLAVYATVLSFGIASLVVGIILLAVEEVAL